MPKSYEAYLKRRTLLRERHFDIMLAVLVSLVELELQ